MKGVTLATARLQPTLEKSTPPTNRFCTLQKCLGSECEHMAEEYLMRGRIVLLYAVIHACCWLYNQSRWFHYATNQKTDGGWQLEAHSYWAIERLDPQHLVRGGSRTCNSSGYHLVATTLCGYPTGVWSGWSHRAPWAEALQRAVLLCHLCLPGLWGLRV